MLRSSLEYSDDLYTVFNTSMEKMVYITEGSYKSLFHPVPHIKKEDNKKIWEHLR